MDQRLKERLIKIDKQIDVLQGVEEQYLYLKAHKDVLFAELYRATTESGVSAKESQVHSSQEWKDFAYGLAKTEAEYNKQRRIYELKLKAYDAEHLTLKTEHPAVKRQL